MFSIMRFFVFQYVILTLILSNVALSQNRPAPPQQASDLYFISVGIGEYTQETQDGQAHLRSAEISAKLVSRALIRQGARYGIQITSRLTEGSRGYSVTRQDILDAVIDLKDRMRRDRASAPRVIIYIMGHGYGDPDFDLLFLQPGDVAITDGDRSQMGVSHLVQKTVWNGDLLSAAVNFRTHRSMEYMDKFFPSQIMPDLTQPLSGLQTAARAAELQRLSQEAGRTIGFLPGGNPPVPFVVLFDNCFVQIQQNIVVDTSFFGSMIQGMWEEIISDGLVFYAAQPGLPQLDIAVPDWIDGQRGERMGPLGAALIKVLDDGNFSTFGEFQSQMTARFALEHDPNWSPYARSNRLVADVARAQLIPARPGRGELDIRHGSN